MSKPIVAIIGKPNVGKSTFFNYLVGSRVSIVQDTPGVTRDRIYADTNWRGRNFTLIDTAGIEPESEDIILSQMREQANLAISMADVIIFLTDIRQGITAADQEIAVMLKKSGKPIVLVCNKADNFEKDREEIYEFYNLGLGDPYPISASNAIGIGDVLDKIYESFPEKTQDEDEEDIIKIKDFAKKMNLEVWFSVSPVRPDVVYDEHGVPNTLLKYYDLIDVLVALRYDDKIDKVVMTVVRAHHEDVPKPMGVNLDPKTMLISK